MNKTFLVGRTTKDIECRYTATSQKAVARFTLAVNRRSKEDGADFISCIAWGKTAELLEKYVKKGHQISVIGRIQTGSYEKDGRTIYTTDVVVEEMEFLEKRQGSSSQTPPEANTPQESNTPQEADEEIPEGFEYLDDDLPF